MTILRRTTVRIETGFFRGGKLLSRRLLYITLLALFAPSLLFGQPLVGTIQRPGFIPFSLGIYEGGNKLFVSDWDSNQLLIYDCTTLGLISELDLGKDVASGIYLCGMQAEEVIMTRKMLLLR